MSGDGLLRSILRAHRWRTAGAAGLLSAHQAFEALVPVTVGAAIDEAVAPSDSRALVLWLGLLAVLFFFLAGAFRTGARVSTATMERAAHGVRLRLAERVLDPRGGGEGSRLPGQLLSLATADVDAAAVIVRAVAFGAATVAALLSGTVVLLLTSLELGLLVLVGLPLTLLAANRLARPLSRRASAQQARAADAAGTATDLVEGLRVLQGIGGVEAGVDRYRAASRRSLRATLSAARAEAGFEASAVLVAGLALAAVALYGGRLAASGEISIGELIAAVGVTQFLVGPLSRLAWVGSMLARARASGARLEEALAAPPAVSGGDGERVERGGLVVEGLLDVPEGTVHGVATTDASSLLDWLGREREGGAVAVGGVDLRSLTPGAARATVVVCPHEPALLADTVVGNVEAAGGGEEAVRRAIAAAAVDEVLETLPAGAALSDGGRSLSGGQRQRVALARALAAPAPVLVLHEPTTALDAATEARVAAGLRDVRAGRTTVLVTTSPALLAVCDEVTVLRDGRVAARGTHAALLASDAAYREAVLT